MNFIEIQIIFLIVALGFYYFVNVAWKERKGSFALKSFFLGGAKIGPTLTEHNTIGMTFAWSGGTWFFATIAFTFGPWVLLMQIPWCISIIALGLLFSRIHAVTKNKTIHGFLQDAYGNKVRIIASIATALGYFFNTGFELYWSALLFCNIIGRPELSLWVALIFASITAIYCSIGGYKANASTDKPQNIIGVAALSAVSIFAAYNSGSHILELTSLIFGVGSFVYIFLSYFFPDVITSKQAKILSRLAIILALLTVLCAFWLSTQNSTPIDTVIFKNTPFPIHLLIGIVVFQLFFNIVDMANWQGIAANGDIDRKNHRQLKWAIIRSALYLNWFPALGGVIIGLALRVGFTGVDDNNIFHFAFSTVLPNQDVFLRALVLGLLTLGFISTTLSTADSYLMSATHTISYDILYHKKVSELLATDTVEEEERKFVLIAKRFLLPLSIMMVMLFWGAFKLYKQIGGNALDFQMIMYSFAISLFPSVIYGLFRGIDKAHRYDNIAFASILCGILASIVPYVTIVVSKSSPELRGLIVNLTPVYSVVLSSLIFSGGVIIKKIISKNV